MSDFESYKAKQEQDGAFHKNKGKKRCQDCKGSQKQSC